MATPKVMTVVDDLLDVKKKVQPGADQKPEGVVVVRNDTQTIFRVSREKSQRQKGQPAAANGGGKKVQPAAAKGGRIHGMGKASASLEEPASGGGKGWKGFGGH